MAWSDEIGTSSKSTKMLSLPRFVRTLSSSASASRFYSSSTYVRSNIPSFRSPKDMLDDLESKTASGSYRNYFGCVNDMSAEAISVETDLFPREALEYYTGKNLDLLEAENPHHAQLSQRYFNPSRGGDQGDYSWGIQQKISNVVDCLHEFPSSKRAILTLPYSQITSTEADHSVDAEAKCLRELHFYLHEPSELIHGTGAPSVPWQTLLPSLELTGYSSPGSSKGDLSILSCTGLMRANAAIIFPKNVHFIGAVMHGIASELGVLVGSYSHFVTHLVSDRS